jgi:NADH-ubiquinone oxidoreductase chain 4L
MNITLILFLIGILGFVLNRKNIILMLISIEIMLLSITFLILVSSLNMDDIIGQTYAIYIIAVAGAESAIGLGILVAFYRLINSPDKNPRSNYSYSHFNLLPAISPSNLIQSRNYSSLSPRTVYSASPEGERKIVLNPRPPATLSLSGARGSFISGFSDAEGSFVVTILKNPRYKTG